MAAAQSQTARPVVLPSKYNVRTERAVMVPMRDGIKLSVDLLLPDAAGRFPAITWIRRSWDLEIDWITGLTRILG